MAHAPCRSGFSPLSSHLLSFNSTHLPALVLPERLRIPFLCKSARLRSKVRLATDKATAICETVIRESLFINSHIFLCISDNCTTAKLPPQFILHRICPTFLHLYYQSDGDTLIVAVFPILFRLFVWSNLSFQLYHLRKY